MNAPTLKSALAKQTERPTTIAGLLTDPKIKAQMALALPKHMTSERLARIALTEVRKTPALGRADQASFLGAIMQCAQLGLEPGSALGHAYLLPFDNSKKGITEVNLIVGYRGMIDLARRSGQILSIEARAVYKADTFHVELGLNPDLKHVPAWDADDRGPLMFVYAVAKLKDGGTQFEVMSRKEVEAVRLKSKAGKFGPWVDHFEEMAKKTAIRRLFKYLPVSIEIANAVEQDERVDMGLNQDNPLTIDQDTGEITGGHDEGAMSTDKVRGLIESADSQDALEMAKDFIAGVTGEKEKAEFNSLVAKRFAEFEQGAFTVGK